MGEPGGLIEVESALYASKVQLVCPKCGEATRVGHKRAASAFVRNAEMNFK